MRAIALGLLVVVIPAWLLMDSANFASAAEPGLIAKNITREAPQAVSTQEERIPVEKVKKGHGWIWAMLGVALVGGAVAALAGGASGGSSDGSNKGATPSTSGSYEFSW